jgi:hypothetical protein
MVDAASLLKRAVTLGLKIVFEMPKTQSLHCSSATADEQCRLQPRFSDLFLRVALAIFQERLSRPIRTGARAAGRAFLKLQQPECNERHYQCRRSIDCND